MCQSNPDIRRKALASAVLLWAALNGLVAVPYLLDPLAIGKILPLYLGGVLLFLEPLITFWAAYRYLYMVGSQDDESLSDDPDD